MFKGPAEGLTWCVRVQRRDAPCHATPCIDGDALDVLLDHRHPVNPACGTAAHAAVELALAVAVLGDISGLAVRLGDGEVEHGAIEGELALRRDHQREAVEWDGLHAQRDLCGGELRTREVPVIQNTT